MAMIIPFSGNTPVLSDTAWAAPNATLIGNVTIGDKSSVFYGSVLRGDLDAIVIGTGSNLQDNVTVHCDENIPTIVGNGVSVGHGAILHGCTIENDCLIGMGATVLNSAVVGAGSLVAAGSVVLEGTVIPPGSLVAGVPAKVRRELTDEDRAGIVKNASGYVELSSAHALLGE